jgi:hypothetical protein
MDNLKLTVWEIMSGDVHVFVQADRMETVKEYFYIGYAGSIVQKKDMPATADMRVLIPKPPTSAKSSDFTKLELASLMIAQGQVDQFGRINSTTLNEPWVKNFAIVCATLAKAVLEEANK